MVAKIVEVQIYIMPPFITVFLVSKALTLNEHIFESLMGKIFMGNEFIL